jgi:DUF4097 and DUF4098 domain-containing protein YvlB
MANWDFPCSDPIDLDVALSAGSIAVTAEPTDVITVSLTSDRPGKAGQEAVASVRVEFSDGRLEIAEPKQSGFIRRGSSFTLAVHVPTGSRCTVNTAACDLSCEGTLGSLTVRTASGDVSAAEVTGPARLQTASGDVRVEAVASEVRVQTATGASWLKRVDGDIFAETVSGDVSIGTAGACATVKTASGDVRIASISAGHGDVNSVSGNIAVGVAPGVGVYLDLSSLTGQVTSELDRPDAEGRADLQLRCRTVSGDLRVTRAVLVGDAS